MPALAVSPIVAALEHLEVEHDAVRAAPVTEVVVSLVEARRRCRTRGSRAGSATVCCGAAARGVRGVDRLIGRSVHMAPGDGIDGGADGVREMQVVRSAACWRRRRRGRRHPVGSPSDGSRCIQRSLLQTFRPDCLTPATSGVELGAGILSRAASALQSSVKWGDR